MLIKGLDSGRWDGCKNLAGFSQSDITSLEFKDKIFDCSICLRLMHRIPLEIKEKAIKELKRVTSDYLIISTGILRNSISTWITGKKSKNVRMKIDEWESFISQYGTIERHIFVSKIFSNEIISIIGYSGLK